ncbi:MAG TPA: nucleotidyltransferase [Rhodobacteraceae bacterium]|jgi:MurNAc alpha-1-phosphate uridylyltransferase|nr:nucleotidyltransferase family protein [Paracoccaceae bacterium]HBG97467.1 nucleotidyltransferase [Paracoccaceae bacterium]
MTRPLMVFAAGFGTRMGALTRDRPKPLIAVAGRPLIDHALDHGRAAGAGPIAVNAHYLADRIAAHLAGAPDVALSREVPEILDTGGGLRAALPLLRPGPVFTLNADAVFAGPEPLPILDAAWDATRMDALLLLVPLARAVGHGGSGDFRADAQGRLRRAAAGGPGAPLVYSGAQILDPADLGAIPDRAFSLNRVWDKAAAAGRLHGVVYPGHWADVGTPAGIDAAEALLAAARDV